MRSRFLVCYDIRNDVRLRRTAKVAETFGSRLNYSVFLCDLSGVELTRLEAGLRDAVDLSADSVLIVDLGPAGPQTERRLRWLCGGTPLPESGTAAIV
ncbi:MAG: CRISPR-associated endonuclease Cas2 [Thermoleophilia bacterium]|nr:CRISPR-associated endonuclease Cas2 [Thermoleophilia bacterium]